MNTNDGEIFEEQPLLITNAKKAHSINTGMNWSGNLDEQK